MLGLPSPRPGVVVVAPWTTPKTIAEIICDGKHPTPAQCKVLVKRQGLGLTWFSSPDCALACGGKCPRVSIRWRSGLVVHARWPWLTCATADSIAGLGPHARRRAQELLTTGVIRGGTGRGRPFPHWQQGKVACPFCQPGHRLGGSCGSIVPGRDADVVILNADLTLDATYVGGSLVR